MLDSIFMNNVYKIFMRHSPDFVSIAISETVRRYMHVEQRPKTSLLCLRILQMNFKGLSEHLEHYYKKV